MTLVCYRHKQDRQTSSGGISLRNIHQNISEHSSLLSASVEREFGNDERVSMPTMHCQPMKSQEHAVN